MHILLLNVLRITTLTICIFFTTHSWADRNHTFVECVQRQMEYLGYVSSFNPGVIDSNTITGFKTLIEKRRNTEQPLPDLSMENVVFTCRQLGIENFRLRFFWPSFRKTTKFEFSEGLSEKSRTAIRDAIKYAQNRLEIRLADKTIIIAGNNKRSIFELREKYWPGSIQYPIFSELFDSTCSKNNQYFGGMAYKNLIILCEIEDSQTNKSLYMFDLKSTIAHEYIHVLQYELSGRPDFGADLSVNLWGPNWLLEGIAQYFAIKSVFPADQLGDYQKALKSRLKGNWKNLELYESDLLDHSHTTNLYNNGLYAVFHLANKYGDKLLLSFYEDMGSGLTWHQSFEKNFDLPPVKFYEEYRQTAN